MVTGTGSGSAWTTPIIAPNKAKNVPVANGYGMAATREILNFMD